MSNILLLHMSLEDLIYKFWERWMSFNNEISNILGVI